MTIHARPLGALALTALLALGGCGSGPVEVPPPQPGPRAARACHDLARLLPPQLAGQARRQTEPPSSFVTAWGSPPLILRCGVDQPAGMQPSSRLAVVNGVAWFPEPRRSPMRFTTVERAARVELLLPEKYAPPADEFVRLADAIKEAIPKGSAA